MQLYPLSSGISLVTVSEIPSCLPSMLLRIDCSLRGYVSSFLCLQYFPQHAYRDLSFTFFLKFSTVSYATWPPYPKFKPHYLPKNLTSALLFWALFVILHFLIICLQDKLRAEGFYILWGVLFCSPLGHSACKKSSWHTVGAK